MQTERTNIFNRIVSVFANVKDTEPITSTELIKVLTSTKVKSKVEAYRETKDKEIKLSIPAFTPSGVVGGRRKDENISHNGLICIDVDKKDNLHLSNFEQLKELITQIPYVAYCGLSIGGEGYFIIIPIKEQSQHRRYFKAICDDFRRCGILTDVSCINEARLRFMSFDENPYVNEQAVIYTRLFEETKEIPKQYTFNKYSKDTEKVVQSLISEIQSRHTDITGGYQDWLKIGAAIASGFGESGRYYFHAISSLSPKYKYNDADQKYNECLKMDRVHIDTLFYYAKQSGIILKKENNNSVNIKQVNKQPIISPKMESDFKNVEELMAYAEKAIQQDVKGELYYYLKANGLSTKKIQINL